jgi:hypothetical protein
MRSTDIRIEDPCEEDWGAMRPEDGRRFCDRCTKHVHDLSSMTEAQAREVLARKEDRRVCVRYLHDDQGRIVFRQPDVVPVTSLSRRDVRPAAALAVALAACAPHDNPEAAKPTPVQQVDRHTEIKGGIGEAGTQERPSTPPGTVARMGAASAPPPEVQPDPPPPAVLHEMKGDVGPPIDDKQVPAPTPEPIREVKGEISPVDTIEEPCDPATKKPDPEAEARHAAVRDTPSVKRLDALGEAK